MSPITPEELPHLDAMARARDAGFVTAVLPSTDVLHAERRRGEAVDTYTCIGYDVCSAARFRVEDYPGGPVLWQRTGTVADVLAELLALPRHGEPGAPRRAVRAASELWVPGA